MLGARRTRTVWLWLGVLLCSAPAAAQNLVLTKDCEAGFRRLIQMAQQGGFGEDVTNANVGISDNRVRIELVRRGAESKVVLLARRRATSTSASRYFAVSPGPGATPADVERVTRALDEIFIENPFLRAGVELPPGSSVLGFGEAWRDDSWSGLRRALGRRMMLLASLPYTIGITVGIALALLAILALLWISPPTRPS